VTESALLTGSDPLLRDSAYLFTKFREEIEFSLTSDLISGIGIALVSD
jgi:hypothetical protein